MTRPRITWEPYPYTSVVGQPAPPMYRPIVVDGPTGYALHERALQAEADRLSALGFDVDPLPTTAADAQAVERNAAPIMLPDAFAPLRCPYHNTRFVSSCASCDASVRTWAKANP